MCKRIALFLLAALSVVACSSSSTSSGNNQPGNNEGLSFDQMTTVPVLDGNRTKGTLYIHNYGKEVAQNVHFNLSAQLVNNSDDGAHSAARASDLGIINQSGFQLLNPEQCDTIPAKGYCALNFLTPPLAPGENGSSLVNMIYKQSGVTHVSKQAVNYSYTDRDSHVGINFAGNVDAVIQQNNTRHIVAYIYAGGKAGSRYQNARIKLSKDHSGLKITHGLSAKTEMVSGEVIPVEFSVKMKYNYPLHLEAYAQWDLLGNNKNLNGTVGQLTVNPDPEQPNYLFDNVPYLVVPGASSSGSINVSNNGIVNGDAGGIIASTTNPAITISNDCDGVTLLADNANSCSIGFSAVGASASGSALISFKLKDGSLIDTQTLFYTVKAGGGAAVKGTPSIPNVTYIITDTPVTGAIAFTFTNVGSKVLENPKVVAKNSDNVAIWVQDTNNCTSSLAIGASCTIYGHLLPKLLGSSTIYYSFSATYNNGTVPYTNVSTALSYTIITDAPSLNIIKSSESPIITIANNMDIASKSYKVMNTDSKVIANITANSLSFSPNTITKPYIDAAASNCLGKSLASGEYCNIIVKYGPIATTQVSNEEGNLSLNISYTGLIQDPKVYNISDTDVYKVYGNDSRLDISVPVIISGFSGSGTDADPYIATAKSGTSKLAIRYSNQSKNLAMSNFNISATNLPAGYDVDASSSCPIAPQSITLAPSANCDLVLTLNNDTLETLPYADSIMALDFIPSVANYKIGTASYAKGGDFEYKVQYSQPKISASFQQVDNTLQLSINTVNREYMGDALGLTISSIKDVVSDINVTPSVVGGNCVVNSDSSVTCSDLSTNVVISYTMPRMNTGDIRDIALKLSKDGSSYAVLATPNPSAHYVAPDKKWRDLGDFGLSGSLQPIGTDVDSKGVVYVLVYIGSNTYVVKRYLNNSWETILNSTIQSGGTYAAPPRITVGLDDKLYFYYIDGTNSMLYVQKFNNDVNYWSTVIGKLSITMYNSLKLLVDENGNFYVNTSIKAADSGNLNARGDYFDSLGTFISNYYYTYQMFQGVSYVACANYNAVLWKGTHEVSFTCAGNDPRGGGYLFLNEYIMTPSFQRAADPSFVVKDAKPACNSSNGCDSVVYNYMYYKGAAASLYALYRVNASDGNYGVCRISKLEIPDHTSGTVTTQQIFATSCPYSFPNSGDNQALVVDSNGFPYFRYQSDLGFSIGVYANSKFNEALGGLYISNIPLLMIHDDVIYVAYSDANTQKISVMAYY